MKKLILMRHGKSSWEFDLPDDNRPLKSRGINDARLVSEIFKEKNINFDVVLSSPANRAFSTCKIFLKNFNFNFENIQVVPDLYDFHGENVIKTIKNVDDRYHNIMIFGHNHAFTSICNIFGDKFIENLPTSGLAVIEFEIDSWRDLKKGTTTLTIFPSDYK
ncbi:MAG: histidine phosphatase family protein [Bacteroidota bacterium]